MKKIALLLVCFLMSLAYTAIADTCGDYKYTLLDDGTAEITRYIGTSDDVIVVPEKLDGHVVTSIGVRAFYWKHGLTEIIIPDSVTSIGASAFFHCERLTEITIPDSVTSIGNGAFINCTSLTLIVEQGSYAEQYAIENGLNYKLDYTCSDYEYILLDDGTAEITRYVAGDTTRYIEDGVTTVYDPENDSFRVLSSEIYIPEKLDGHAVTSIGENAFEDCDFLTEISIPDSVAYIGTRAFYFCSSLTEISIPDSVTSIGNQAFYGCESLTKINIPDSVISIGNMVFGYCNSLTEISIPDSMVYMGFNPFLWCDKLTAIKVSPEHSTFATIDGILVNKRVNKLICYPYAFTANSYSIPQGIGSIGNSAFRDCDSLTEISIPDSVTSIEDFAFEFCESISFKVEQGSYAEQYAIENDINYTLINSLDKSLMNKYKEVKIMGYVIIGLLCVIAIVAIVRYPVKQQNNNSKEESSTYSSSSSSYSTTTNTSTVSNKPKEEAYSTSAYTTTATSTPVSNSFFQVSSQEDVTLTGISVITKDIVRMYPLLTNLTIGAGVYRIERDAFRECKRLEKIVIDTDLDEIGRSAFEDLEELREVVGINRVRKIGEWAFCTCSSLTTVTSSNNSGILEEIGECAFVNCKRLSIVNLPNRPIIYGVNCFRDCEAILTVNALNYAKEIGPYAFYGCKSLISALMYGSLTKIGEAAFFGCSNLKYVNIPEGTTSIGDGAFGCCHFEEISFPNSATHIGSGVLRASIYYLKSLTLPEREKHRLNDILGLDNEGYEDKYVSKIEIKYIPQNQNTNNEVEVSAETKTDNSPVSPESTSNTEPQLSKFQQLLNRAESNDPEAMFEVGRAYANGEDIEKDEQKAIYWFEKASELGHAAASNLCGLYCSKANDASRSFEYFKKAYNLGHIDAALNLGNCYEKGKGTNKDLKAAIECYNYALNKGCNSGAYYLGFLYMDAGDTGNEKLYFAKAAEMKHPHGTTIYGIILRQEGNHAQAFEYFKKAKELGDAQGALMLGDCYENGKGVTKNIDVAIECYKLALEKGDSRGANSLCYIYEDLGDIEKVKFYSAKLMELNNSIGFIMYGSCLEKEENYTEAIKYYQKGYELDDEVAAWKLGSLYERGFGTQKDLLKAFELYKFAVDKGSETALRKIALLCKDDDFKGVDEFTKFKYLKMADDAGYEGYCCALAERYRYGEGVEKNIHKCLEYAEKVYMQHKNCTDTLLAVSRSHDALKCTIMINHIFEWEKSNPEVANACVAYFTKLADYGDIGYIDKIAELSIFDETYCDYSKAWKYSQQLINQVQKSDYASDLKSSLESNGHLYIGIMLHDGLGVQRDIQQGLAHLRKAKDLGNKNAEKILNDL